MMNWVGFPPSSPPTRRSIQLTYRRRPPVPYPRRHGSGGSPPSAGPPVPSRSSPRRPPVPSISSPSRPPVPFHKPSRRRRLTSLHRPPVPLATCSLLRGLECPPRLESPTLLAGYQPLVMDHLDEHDGDGDMQMEVASDDSLTRFRSKKRSKVWDEYTPVFVNGAIQSAECRYCHILMSCKGAEGQSNGTSHLWRHQKICRAKDGLGLGQQQQDTDIPYVLNDVEPVDQIPPDSLDDINLVTHSENSKFKSRIWNDFVPFYVDGRIQGADCIHCNKRLSADKGRSNLTRHTLTCSARGGATLNHQKSVFQSSIPNFNSRLQDELSPAMTNGRVQIAEYASKILKGNNSGDKTHAGNHILALPAMDKTNPMRPPAQAPPDIGMKFDQEACCQQLTRMIILHGYPLSIVEHEEMRKFTKSLNPAFNMASSIDIEEYSTLLFAKEKADLKEKLASSSHRVSLSASVWVPQIAEFSVKYLCLSAHFIDSDWKLQRRIIKFGVFWSSPTCLERMIHYKDTCILDSESGPSNVIWEAIRDWNLDKKHFSLTSVSEVRNEGSIPKLMGLLNQQKCLPIGGGLYSIACVGDVLNNIVSKGRLVLHLVGNILERFIQAHMSSSQTRQQLLDVVAHIGLKCPKEDAKWWHKIYFRLEVLLHYRKAFSSEELLSAQDTKITESACQILRAFYRAVEAISGPVCPTANIYFNELWKVRAVLQEEASTDHNELASMVWEMQQAFNEYWQTSYVWLSIPVVLDPRFKVTFIEFRLRRAFGTDAAKYVSVVSDTIRELFQDYCGPEDKAGADTSNREAHDVEVYGFDSDSLEDWDEHLNAQTRSQLLTELDTYLEEGLVPRKDDFDILNWWKVNSTKYPTLSIMARDVLAVPASAVHCEAVLSSEGPVIHKQWSTLNIKTIEALVCVRDWIK